MICFEWPEKITSIYNLKILTQTKNNDNKYCMYVSDPFITSRKWYNINF